MDHSALYHFVSKLRLKASELYDLGKLAGHSEEEIFKSIQPLMMALHEAIQNATPHELALAVKHFEGNISGLQKVIEELNKKIGEEMYHKNILETAILNHMKQHEHTSLHAGPFMLTRVAHEQKEILIIR